jgi:hypothetical protein
MAALTIARSNLAAPFEERAELYAGGTTGLAVLGGGRSPAGWRGLLERAEQLGFSGALCRDPSAAGELRSLGVQRVCLVAAEDDACDALRLAARGVCDALVLLSPRVPGDSGTHALVRSTTLPRLVLAGSTPRDVEQCRRFDAMSVGRIALRFLPSPEVGRLLLEGETGPLAVESVWLFAARVLGLEAPIRHRPQQGARKEKHP